MHFSAELCSVVYFTSLQALEILNCKDDTAQPACPRAQQEDSTHPHKHTAERQIKLLFAVDKNVRALALQLPTAVKYLAF